MFSGPNHYLHLISPIEVFTHIVAAVGQVLTSIHQILALLNNIQPLHITFLHHIVLARARG